MMRLSLLNVGMQPLLWFGCLVLGNCTIFAQSQRYVQIDVRVVGGNPLGLEGTSIYGKPALAWDTGVFSDEVVPPDPKICVENSGAMKCTEGDCPNLYFCTFIGVPISSNTFKLEIWDADIRSAFDPGDDLIGRGLVSGLNRSYKFGQAQVTVTEIPCSDKEIQVLYERDEPTGHYRFDSGFEPYPTFFPVGSPSPHHYERNQGICVVGPRGCDVRTVFETMISQVSFVAPSEDKTPVVNCKVNTLLSPTLLTPDRVRTVIDAKNFTIVNYTLVGHAFYPGKVTRRVVQDGGAIFVTTVGEGFGQAGWLNEQVGGKVIFAEIDDVLKAAVAKKLMLLDKPVNQSKPLKKRAAEGGLISRQPPDGIGKILQRLWVRLESRSNKFKS